MVKVVVTGFGVSVSVNEPVPVWVPAVIDAVERAGPAGGERLREPGRTATHSGVSLDQLLLIDGAGCERRGGWLKGQRR